VGTGSGAYILGDHNDFTVYQQVTGSIIGKNKNKITYKEVVVVTGTYSSSGIKLLKEGFVMTEKSVYTEGDGLESSSTCLFNMNHLLKPDQNWIETLASGSK